MDFEVLKEFFLNPSQGNDRVYLQFRNYIQNRVRNKVKLSDQDTEDLISDICLQCYRAAPRHNPDAAPFSNYMNRIISILIAKAIKKRIVNNELPLSDDQVYAAKVNDYEEVEIVEENEKVLNLIYNLKHSNYKGIILLKLNGLTNEMIAETLKIKKPTAATRLSRALDYLARELDKVGIYI